MPSKTVAVSGSMTNGHLKQLDSRIERLEEEIRELQADRSEVYKEAKDSGFDTKALRTVIAIRRRIREEGRTAIESEFAIIDLYLKNLGDLPLFSAPDVEPVEVKIPDGENLRIINSDDGDRDE